MIACTLLLQQRKHLSVRYIFPHSTPIFFSENVHLYRLSPLSIFLIWNEGRQERSHLISSTLTFPSSCFAWIVVGCIKCSWRCLVVPERRACVWSPYSSGCVPACSLRNDETQCFHAYVCSRVCFHFVSDSTPPYSLIITLCFNPSPPLRLSPPRVSSWGCDLCYSVSLYTESR